MSQNNFYNIPANYKFIETLGNWIIKHYKPNFSELKVFLPNQRLTKKLRIFFQNSGIIHSQNINIKALSDLNIIDFCDYLPNQLCSEIITEISQIKVLSKIDAIFLICQDIAQHPEFSHQNFSQRYKIAKSLYDIFEDLNIEQISTNELANFDDSNLAQHQQFGLDFFIKFYQQINHTLLKNNLMFEAQYHNFLCDKFIEVINTQEISQNIIIAGSTGSILSSRKLIKTLKNYSRGTVFLYGYNLSHQSPALSEIHPQYYLQELINYINIDDSKNPAIPENIHDDNFLNAPLSRTTFCDLVFDDFANHHFNPKNLSFRNHHSSIDILQNIEIIEANHDLEEAKIISKICTQHDLDNTRIGIICNNQNLLQTLILTLNNYQIKYNNTASQSALNTDYINFLILIFELKFNDYNSYNLLALLKNKFFQINNSTKFIEEFEISIIREARIDNGLSGLMHKTTSSRFDKLIAEIFQNLPSDKSIKSLLKASEYFSKNSLESILSSHIAGKEIYNFLLSLVAQNFTIENSEDLKIIFNDINYFEQRSQEANIDILTPIEARLLNYDLLIIASLNENDFPNTTNHGWIGAKIKNALSINKSQKKIGQNAYDFCNYLHNPRIIITRATTRLNSQKVESPFLTRLKTLCHIMNFNLDKTSFYQTLIHQEFSSKRYFIKPPLAIPSQEFLPKKYYITEIAKLMSNPYEIFVKKVLNLTELKNIDYEASFAEFGSFVHKVLEEFIKNPTINNPTKLSEIFEQYFIANTAKLVWYPRFNKFFNDFIENNQQFLHCQNITEQSINTEINDIKLTGKIDRIVIDQDKLLHIFDYKTGSKIPSNIDVAKGLEPQLLIYAYIISQELFKNYQFAELAYWRLNRGDGSKITAVLDDKLKIQHAIEATKIGLENLFNYFHRDRHNFEATTDKSRDNIPNLSRLEEWIN